MIAPKGDVVLCMRETSDRPHVLKNGETGYFHSTGEKPRRPTAPVEKIREPVINVSKIMSEWENDTDDQMIEDLAERLSVEPMALGRLGCVWARQHQAWAFPMCDGYGNFVGIRLRTNDGHKFAVRGSHQGVFLPLTGLIRLGPALILEGPTDTAAALTLGFFAVGRPSCSGGVHDVVTAFRRLRVTEAVLIADNDEVGSRGAAMLQKHLPMRSALMVLPAKDLRSFVQLGGTRELLDSMIENLTWENP